MEATLIALVALFLLLILLWLARETAAPVGLLQETAKLPVEDLRALHCLHFPQVRQALAEADAAFLKGRASPPIRRCALRERKEVARAYLAGLLEDFARLERLGRTVAAFSPRVNRRLEIERLWRGAQFRVAYRLARWRLAAGWSAMAQLTALTERVGVLASQIEQTMAALEQRSWSNLQTGIRV